MAPSPLPPRRSAPSRRLSVWRAVTSPARPLYHWFHGAPRWMQAVLGLLVLGAVGSGGYYAFHTRMETLRQRRVNGAWERLGSQQQETPSAAYGRLRREMIAAERHVFKIARNEGRIPEEVLTRAQRELDLEESQLQRSDD